VNRRTDPLSVAIVDGRLEITIGVETLASAFRTGPVGDRVTYNVDSGRWEEDRIIRLDSDQWAEDVRGALRCEREDGSTRITDLLDGAFQAAIDDGAEGVDIRDILPPEPEGQR